MIELKREVPARLRAFDGMKLTDSEDPAMKLYGTPPTRAARVLWVLKHLEMDCEVIFVSLLRGDHHSPEFLALNPAARVPVLQDGLQVITESTAICLYLAEKDPLGRLLPEDPAERAQMYRWLFFLATEIESPLERIERHSALYPEEDRSSREVERAKSEGRQMCAVLEQHLADRKFLAGEELSVADLVAAYTLSWAEENGLLKDAPCLKRFVAEMYALPSAPPTNQRSLEALKTRLGEDIDWFALR